ncbi:tenascin-R-like isoform X2 [Gadus chalcogrammus]|uniref:tenascin-R-like isoform X2 n=1 Tax=Gadus chalcogrammus TaxID=1042646 RepID=UPI0024C49268|nr:tenascin-R-like isoform X2 [Gadus chalcogrammus]XP_056431984.1 tenascin-R-like isoform X2 [Gadus chalcogrammus]
MAEESAGIDSMKEETDLKPGLKYDFQIKTQLKSGGLSHPALASAHTEAIPPGNVHVSHITSSTVSLTWETPAGEVGGYVVTCSCDSEAHREQTTDSNSVTFHDLKPGLTYDFQIKTQLKSGRLSQPALTSAHTELSYPQKRNWRIFSKILA